jgi:GT2 family glycosyltransferase
MKQETRVSIILVNYNGMSHIDICISSILNQSHTNFETIFVDNNSNDGSLEYARNKFPSLIFVANKANMGYPAGINSGLAVATGKYIAPLNTDTEVSTNWLSIMSNFLDTHLKAGAVMPKILLFHDHTKINTIGSNIHITGLSFCCKLNKVDNKPFSVNRVPGISGCSYMIKREIIEQLGGIPEESSMGNDDVMLSWLVNLMGWEIYCIHEAIIYHKYKVSMSPEKLFQLEKGRQTLLLYSLKPLTATIYLPILVGTELFIWSYCLLKGQGYIKAKLRILKELYRDREHIKQRRNQVQGLRKISDLQLFRKLKWNLEWEQILRSLIK